MARFQWHAAAIACPRTEREDPLAILASPWPRHSLAQARPRNPAFPRPGFGTAVLFPSEREAACRFVEGFLQRYQQKEQVT